MISYHWFRTGNGLALNKHQAITWAHADKIVGYLATKTFFLFYWYQNLWKPMGFPPPHGNQHIKAKWSPYAIMDQG